jgi:hypothetical protein
MRDDPELRSWAGSNSGIFSRDERTNLFVEIGHILWSDDFFFALARIKT